MSEPIIIQGKYGETTITPHEGEYAAENTNPQRIADTANELDVRIPDQYERFLLTINGGEIEPRGVAYLYSEDDIPTLHKFLSPDDEIVRDQLCIVRDFYSIDHKEEFLNLFSANKSVKEWGRPGLLGIAETNIGDFIVLDLAEGGQYGSVHYLTIHGVAALEDTGEDVPLGYIAPDFDTFLTLFFDYDGIIDEQVQEILQERNR